MNLGVRIACNYKNMRNLIRPCDLLSVSDPEGTIAKVRALQTWRNEQEKQRKFQRRIRERIGR
jgi:hypothetical protein